MTRSLEYSIQYAFEHTGSRGYGIVCSDHNFDAPTKFMEIPINRSSFEVPVYALSALQNIVDSNYETNVMVAELCTRDFIPSYKTINRYMRDLLYSDFSTYRLVRCTLPAPSATYYVTKGTILDEQYHPMAMMSWVINKVDEDRYEFVQPILRMHPSCVLAQVDNMRKYIMKQLLPAVLTTQVDAPTRIRGFRSHVGLPIKVEIADSPFSIHSVVAPDIHITDSRLLHVAQEHLNELLP